MKKIYVVVPLLCIVLLFGGCSNSKDTFDEAAFKADTNTLKQLYFPEEYQVKNIKGEVSSFGLNIAPADEMGDWVVDWVANISEGEGFQYFVYSDPDSWDVYLCYPQNRTKLPLLSNDDVQVDFPDNTLKVYIAESLNPTAASDYVGDWVLHFSAYPRGVWPSAVELYWNGVEISCDAVSFEA